MQKYIRPMTTLLFALIGLTVFATETVQKSPTQNVISASDGLVANPTTKVNMSESTLVVMGFAQLQTKMPAGDVGELVIWNQTKLQTETALIAYINTDLKIPARITSDEEREFLKNAFSQDTIKAVVDQLTAKDPQKTKGYQRSYAYIVHLNTTKIATVVEVATTPAVLAVKPTLLLTEDTVLPQGLLNIAIVSKDMQIADSLKLLNTSAGRNYMRVSDQTFEKNFIDNHQLKIQQSLDQADAIQREHLTAIAVTRTPDKIATITLPATTIASTSHGGN